MYLRGLALGMIVTAIVLSIGNTSKSKELTDSEIRAKAKALGMVDPKDTTLADEFKEEVPEGQSEVAEETEATEEPEITEEPEVAEEPEVTEEPEAAEEPEAIEEQIAEDTNEPVKTSTCTITVNRGNGSDTVAKLLEKGGAIDSAKDFDKYLCENKLDNKISVGKYEIPAGADYETIAKIITNRK